jgi:hypothetical protein
MNRLVISGTLAADPKVQLGLGAHESGAAATAMLIYANSGSQLRLVAVGGTAQQFAEFHSKDDVLVEGYIRAYGTEIELFVSSIQPYESRAVAFGYTSPLRFDSRGMRVPKKIKRHWGR